MRERITEEYLPQAIAMGIGVEMFWGMTARTLRPFVLAEDIKFKKKNEFAYLVGRYTFDAISIAVSNALRGKGENPIPYMDKPYDFDKTEEEYEKEAMQKNADKVKSAFMKFAGNMNMNMEKKDG